MEKDNFKSDVVFRVDNSNKEVFALFPHEVVTYDGNVNCYQHIGQHSSADYKHYIAQSKPADKDSYKSLKKELENIGYDLNIVKKQNYDKYLESYKEVNGWT